MWRISPIQTRKLSRIIQTLYEKKDYFRLKKLLMRYHPADIEQAIRFMQPHEVATILKILGGVLTFEVFEFLNTDAQEEVIEHFSNPEIKILLEELPDDERTSFLKGLDPDVSSRLLSLLTVEEREEAEDLLSYESESAASFMTKDFAWIPDNINANQALKQIRKQAPNKETIYYIYVLNEDKQLIGFVSLEKLILADPKLAIQKIMAHEMVMVRDNEDIEVAANLIQKYDLLALPVVDEEGSLLGIITHDDALDILIREDTEDMEKFAGLTGETTEEPYLKQTVFDHVKRRVTWTLIPAIMELFSGMVVHSYQEVLNNFFILAFYMPMIAATGGNTGSQSASMIIRALALNELSFKDFFKVVRREISTALVLGIVLGLFIFLRIILFPEAHSTIPILQIGLAVSIAIVLQVISSSFFGSALPLVATKLKIDPAVMSSPVLASAVDITGLLIYFNSAKFFLGHLIG